MRAQIIGSMTQDQLWNQIGDSDCTTVNPDDFRALLRQSWFAKIGTGNPDTTVGIEFVRGGRHFFVWSSTD